MAASVSIPLATSQRIIPVKVIEENRRLINHHRSLVGRSKVSYTHVIGWAIVKAVAANPALNHAFAQNGAGEIFRDENTGNLIYICETGALAAIPAK